MNRLLLTGALAVAMLFPAITADAQSSQAMEQLYGQGVHAYHSGQMQNAMDAFSQAIQLGSRDPRVYYFRGLAHAGQGNMNAANGDFSIGAQMEASSTGRHFAVSRSLERVQGQVRLDIEDARRNARLVIRNQNQGMSSPGFVDNTTTPTIPDPAPAGQVAPMQTNFPDVSGIQNPGTPFADPSAVAPTPESTTERDDPFGQSGPPVPAETAEAAPFGSEEPSTEPPTEEPMEEADPFGKPGPEQPAEEPMEQADPFGEEAPSEQPAEEPMEEADPFGKPGPDQPAEEPMEEAPSEQPAEEPMEEADPFGEEAPAEQPAEEPMEEADPFGEEAPAEQPAEEPMEEDPFGEEAPEKPGEEEPMEEDPFGEEAPEEPSEEDPGEEDPGEEEGDESPPDDPFGEDGTP